MILYCTRCGILTHFLSMGFWSLNLFLCLCLFAQIRPLSDSRWGKHNGERAGERERKRERKRERQRETERESKPRRCRRSIRVIYINFFIMKYFKNKLNTWKEKCPLHIQMVLVFKVIKGKKKSKWSYSGFWLSVTGVCCVTNMKGSFSFPGDQVGWWPDHFPGLKSYCRSSVGECCYLIALLQQPTALAVVQSSHRCQWGHNLKAGGCWETKIHSSII